MATIEVSSGLESVMTPCVHYRFHWMGDRWKQEIVSVGVCQAIPRVWSTEGLISPDRPPTLASPAFQRLKIEHDGAGRTVARLGGRSGPRHVSATFTFEERPDEEVVEVEVVDGGAEASSSLTATYLIESSGGHLQLGGDASATITWPHPETRLVFEAEPPARIEAHEAGMGTIRLKALVEPGSTDGVRTLRYRWRWIPMPTPHGTHLDA